jgi:hypothetical protein
LLTHVLQAKFYPLSGDRSKGKKSSRSRSEKHFTLPAAAWGMPEGIPELAIRGALLQLLTYQRATWEHDFMLPLAFQVQAIAGSSQGGRVAL